MSSPPARNRRQSRSITGWTDRAAFLSQMFHLYPAGGCGESDMGGVWPVTIEIEQPIGEYNVFINPHGANKTIVLSVCDKESYLITSIEIVLENCLRMAISLSIIRLLFAIR